ncbi:MAG: rod shape-determining protein [Deltaproteobacteria bacterium]|uniref:Cell shape-determining protein MreB n=1 Tax=Candidatus Zymogenus saltonus TaxID=2844893 RepID=A0A9D8PP94_9DELT|nr:rod shape-determining protein [Candidatus Zymogenus saltonus]
MILNSLVDIVSNDLSIDLGTTNTLVYLKGKGIVADEPSVVAIKEGPRGERKIIAVGKEAKLMLGRTPEEIVAIRPLKDGVIADFEITEHMLKHFIKRASPRRSLIRPKIIIAVPSGITPVERRAVIESASTAGAREVYLIDEPIAAAIGVGLPISEPSGNMIVDIGGGTTEVAVISMNGIVYSESVKVGGNKMDEAIVQYLKRKYNFLIGESSAEKLKMELGTALVEGENRTVDIKGRDLVSGIPKVQSVSAVEVNEALSIPMDMIVETVLRALENTPPELSSDFVDKGIVISGGGALIKNIDRLLKKETKLPIIIAENPLSVVVLGCGRTLDDQDLLKQVAVLGR